MMVYTWWCWHIYKGDEVGVDVDQLGDKTEARRVRNSTDRVFDGATGALYRKDRVSQSGPDARVLRPVSGGRERAGVDLRPDAGAESDRTLAVCVWSELTYGDVGRAEAGE